MWTRPPVSCCGATNGAMSEEPMKASLVELARRDRYVSLLGLELVKSGAGTAVVRGVVRPEHVSFNGTCHGGFAFSLADTAFGLASNSHGAMAIGIDTHMVFTAAAREGDELTATALEISRSRRLATYEVEVLKSDGRRIGRFTGTVYIPPAKTSAG